MSSTTVVCEHCHPSLQKARYNAANTVWPVPHMMKCSCSYVRLFTLMRPCVLLHMTVCVASPWRNHILLVFVFVLVSTFVADVAHHWKGYVLSLIQAVKLDMWWSWMRMQVVDLFLDHVFLFSGIRHWHWNGWDHVSTQVAHGVWCAE